MELLPPEVHGQGCRRDFSLRRIEGGPLEEKEVAEGVTKELLKVRGQGACSAACCVSVFLLLKVEPCHARAAGRLVEAEVA